MNPWRRRPTEPEQPEEPISKEDLAWRIGATEVRPAHFDEEEAEAEAAAAATAAAAAAGGAAAPGSREEVAAAPATDAAPTEPESLSDGDAAAAERAAAAAAAGGPGLLIGDSAWTALQPRPEPRPAHAVQRSLRRPGARRAPSGDGGPRRVRLWRDVSALLFVVVAIALIAQLTLSRNGGIAAASVSPTPTLEQTLLAVAPTGTSALTVAITIGPVINPSLIPVIEGTPSPGPIITLPPATPRPTRPTPRSTQRPGPTPAPTSHPTPTPTPVPTTAPPVAKFTASAACGPAPLQVTFNASSSTGKISSYSWNFDDGLPASGVSVNHTFIFSASQPQYNVILIVVGPGGTAFSSTSIKVPC